MHCEKTGFTPYELPLTDSGGAGEREFLMQPRKLNGERSRLKRIMSEFEQVVEQGGELHLLVFPCCFPHACEPLGHALPALRRVRVRLTGVLLDQRPSLPLSADNLASLFKWFIGSTPLCD